MSIDKATVDNACAPASDAMSIDNARAPASNTTNATSIDNTCAPASNATNATSIDKAIVDKAGAGVGSDSSALKDIQDLIPDKTQSKVSDNSQFANQELEAESFLRGISNEVKWQELILKWLAFEKDYPIKGVIFLFFNVVSFGGNDMLMISYIEVINYGLPGGSCVVAEEGSQVQGNSTNQEDE
jgi:hypothetical protein